MKKYLTMAAFSLFVALTIFTTKAVIAATSCWDLESKDCADRVNCNACTPVCGEAKVPYKTDKCKCVTSGTYSCEKDPLRKVDCYTTLSCYTGTALCATDPSEKKCFTATLGLREKHTLTVLSGSGCTTD